MAFCAGGDGRSTYQQTDFIVRGKLYYGLLRGKMELGSFLRDEKEKLDSSDACCYCGSQMDLTLDHLIPKFKGGANSADNLIVACRPCNSSKRALDLLEWMAKRGEFPPLRLLRRYLKLAIHYCIDNSLMDVPLGQIEGISPEPSPLFDNLQMDIALEGPKTAKLNLPFAMALIPHTFPNLDDLVARVPVAEESDEQRRESKS